MHAIQWQPWHSVRDSASLPVAPSYTCTFTREFISPASPLFVPLRSHNRQFVIFFTQSLTHNIIAMLFLFLVLRSLFPITPIALTKKSSQSKPFWAPIPLRPTDHKSCLFSQMSAEHGWTPLNTIEQHCCQWWGSAQHLLFAVRLRLSFGSFVPSVPPLVRFVQFLQLCSPLLLDYIVLGIVGTVSYNVGHPFLHPWSAAFVRSPKVVAQLAQQSPHSALSSQCMWISIFKFRVTRVDGSSSNSSALS